jgi:signal peptidase I
MTEYLKITLDSLANGETVYYREGGNSMTPIIKSREEVTLSPFNRELKKGDIVLCKVRGNYYTHKVYGKKGNQYLIGNNHGHMNGWTEKIFGIVIEISRTPYKASRNKEDKDEDTK